MRKNYFSGLAAFFLLSAVSMLVSCSDGSMVSSSRSGESEVKVGTLRISTGDKSRSLDVSSIKSARIVISGTGIEGDLSCEVGITGGKNNDDEDIVIENVPTGANRVISVYARDEDGKELFGGAIRNVKNIGAGLNTCSVTKATTALGNVFYQIAGKPFVILGVASWNIIKCFGYAVWNFGSGYNLINGKYTGGLWTFPNYEKTKARAEVAKEENRIQYYPQYHLPFTNNPIYVEKYDRDISVTMLEDGKIEEIVPVESYEVDNSLSVKRSAAADAASTAAITGLIGTVITIPISAISWVGGIVAGVAVNFM